MKTYQLKTFNDLLKIPADRRAACFRDLEYALSLHELACGDVKATFKVMNWTDDGRRVLTIYDQNGNELLSLNVTEAELNPVTAQ